MTKLKGELKPRLLKLRKSRIIWEAPEVETINPYAKTVGKGKTARQDKRMRFATINFKLPLDTMNVETIIINGVVAWDFKGEPVKSSIIGGGGRFRHERRFYERVMVSQTLLIKDLPCYGDGQPLIDVVLSKFIEDAK